MYPIRMEPNRSSPETRFQPARRAGAAAVVAFGPALVLALVVTAAAFRNPPEEPTPGLRSVPVVLVPGWYEEATDLEPLSRRLTDAGWPADRIATVSFADPVGSNADHAREIADHVDRLRERTGARRVDIVAHSMGGLAVRYFLSDPERAPEARRVVFLGTPQRGTWIAYFAWGDGGGEMIPESEFLDSLNAQPPVPSGVDALTIRTPVDTHIVPGENATLPGVPDVEVCCPTHGGLVDDGGTFGVVHAFLAEGRRIDPDPLSR